MRKIVLLGVAMTALTTAAWANAVDDELLSAQAAFRLALKTQGEYEQKVLSLREQLNQAQQRKAATEADVNRLSQQLNEVQQQKVSSDDALKQVGERLDAAWKAARGNR